jgi:MoxR-like ATPase
LLPPDNSTFFRKSIGTYVCARFGKPVGRITSSNEELKSLASHFGSTCPDHGKPKPSSPDYEKATFKVMLPDPQVLGKTIDPSSQELVRSCAGCVNLVKDVAVAAELGWTTGLCAAKGKLLLANRHVLEARNCEYREFGTPRASTMGLTFLPEYEENFANQADPVRAFQNRQATWVEPSEYPTDRPVAPEDEHKLSAWRRIEDPHTGNEIFLPIYKPEFFSDEMRALIPTTGDDEHPEDYVDHSNFVYKVAVLWTELDETPAFWGKAGTGKTEFFRHMAYLMQLPFFRFSITASTEVDDLVGRTAFTQGVGTHFEEGRFVKAWRNPCVMVVDELNTGQPDVQQVLRPCIDNSKQLVIDQAADAKPIDRDVDCYLGVAMNPAWDVLNVGANMIGDADANRLMHLFVELPPRPLEEEIIKTRCHHDGWEIPKESLDLVMNIATDLRALTDNGTLPISWAIRPQIKVARALRWFDTLTAYRMAAADYLEPQQMDMLLDVVKSHSDELSPF